MKAVSTALNNILTGSSTYRMADLWTITLKNGTVLRYTDADINLTLSGDTFYANDVLLKGAGVNWTTGLEVGEDNLEMFPSPTSMVGAIPFKEAVKAGLFDRAIVRRERVFMTTWGDTSPGSVVLFVGEVTDPQATRNTVNMTCKDMRNLLNVNMNSRQFQPTCGFVFGDSNCGVVRAALAKTSTVLSGSSGSVINCSLTDAAGYFNNGVLTFTSGQNTGVSRSVKYWTPGQVQLVAPFPYTPAIGDAFSLTPGCTKNFAGATQAFTAGATSGSTPNYIHCDLTHAAGYFNGGTLQFTSGANVGQTRTVSAWVAGMATVSSAFSNTPAIGDTFVITAVSTNTVGSCTGYSNTTKFGGMRFVPVAETSY